MGVGVVGREGEGGGRISSKKKGKWRGRREGERPQNDEEQTFIVDFPWLLCVSVCFRIRGQSIIPFDIFRRCVSVDI